MKGKTTTLSAAEAGEIAMWLENQLPTPAVTGEYIDAALLKCLIDCLRQRRTLKVSE